MELIVIDGMRLVGGSRNAIKHIYKCKYKYKYKIQEIPEGAVGGRLEDVGMQSKQRKPRQCQKLPSSLQPFLLNVLFQIYLKTK